MEVRFSRQAHNKPRLYKLNKAKVEEVVNSGERLGQGEKFEPRQENLRVIWVMVGPYALVITVIKEE